MASLTILKSIAIIVISIGVGFLYFYIMSPDSKQIKRKQIDEMLSILINFIIFIWIGKIIINFSIFIKDPFVVLAYPSNSSSFYIATGLVIINILYRTRRKNITVIEWFYLFVPVLITAIFIYEFMQWTINGQTYNGLLLLFITIILLILTLKKKKESRFIIVITAILTVGLFIIALSSSLMTLFGYILSPWYFLIISLFMIPIVYSHKRKV